MVFKSVNEAILAYENQEATLHSRVKVRVSKTMSDGTVKTGTIDSTIGRFIFNEIIPQDLGFVDRSIPENELKLEVDFHVAKKQLKQILEKPNQGTASADYIASKGLATKVAVIYNSSDAYSSGIYDNFKAEAAAKDVYKRQGLYGKLRQHFDT